MVEYLIAQGDDVYSLFYGKDLYEIAKSEGKTDIARILEPYYNNVE